MAVRGIAARTASVVGIRRLAFPGLQVPNAQRTLQRPFSTNLCLAKPLCSDSLKTAQPAKITDAEFHELADQYIEEILAKYEDMQDDGKDIDVEYSVC
jgi:frataxin